MIKINLDELSEKYKINQLSKIPLNTGGIYLLYDINNALLYIGRSIDLSKRVTSHLTGKTHTVGFYKEIKYFRFLPTNSKIEQKIYELYTINTLLPKYNAVDIYDDVEEFVKTDEEIQKERFAHFVVKLLKANKGTTLGLHTIREICSNNNVHIYNFFDEVVQKVFKDNKVQFNNQKFSI